MPEDEFAPKKQGVYGWRAFLLMIGCGTLAAVTIIGTVVGGFKLLTSGGSSENNVSSGQDVPDRNPRESMEVGALDLCEVTETDVLPGMGGSRIDAQEEPIDTGGAEGRTASDKCEWSFTSQNYGERVLKFSYEAYVTDSDEGSKEDLSHEKYRSEKEAIDDRFSEIKDEGDAENLDSEAHFYYGESSEGNGKYAVIGKMKSSVYVAEFEDTESNPVFDEQYERSFRSESAQLDRSIFTEVGRRLPD